MHRYEATVRWHGSTGEGYERYTREHTVSAEPAKASLALSSDPSFRGDAALLNPEQLVVMAASSCQLLSFLATAARARVDVISYEDHAEAEMPEEPRPMSIARIYLRPVITVRAQVDEARLGHLAEIAHHECFIANSLKTEILVEPVFHIV